ncbi:MAG: AMMECR1 domain-containing protein [Candidatus Andersenbacteria bacterium]
MSGGYITKLAKQAADHYVKTGETLPLPATLPPELYQQRACYVSIFENPGRNLRAMYGQILPRFRSLGEEVIMNTLQAMQRRTSGRFRRVDLSYLSYSVGIVGPLERITSPVHLNPQQYGLYLRSDRSKTAVLLPQRTGIDTPDEQIATAIRESGVNPDSESITMYRFAVFYYD